MDRTLLAHFGKPKVFLPVIHPISPDAAHEAIDVARDAGADGVFLINQGMRATALLLLLEEVRTIHPDLWLGVNLLGREPARVFELVRDLGVRGIWVDNATKVDLDEVTRDHPSRPLLFGGVGFKYQPSVQLHHLPYFAQDALRRGVDVVTTSGEATGEAASLGKVRAIGAGLDGKPLGLASGVTPENVVEYLPFVDAFLVASGIEREFGVLDPDKTRRLAEEIHGWTAP